MNTPRILSPIAILNLLIGLCTTAHAAGVILFTDASYPVVLDFVSATKANVAFTLVVRPDGRKQEVPNGKIVAIFENPPAQPDAAAAAKAAVALAQIDAALARFPRRQYPEVHSKLVPLAAKWRAAQQLAASVKTTATPVPSSSTSSVAMAKGTVITTLDGQRYDEVSITRVDPDALSFTHAAGAATVDFENLPPELRTKYNYDAVKAKEAREARRQKSDAAKSLGMQQRTEAPQPPTSESTEPKPAKAWVSRATSLRSMMTAYRISDADDVEGQSQLKPGYGYLIQGMVGQADDAGIIMRSYVTKRPSAVLLFANPSALQTTKLERDNDIAAVVRMKEFRTVPMTDGTAERLPVFEVFGIEIRQTGAFVNTEAGTK
jgi:hypothetical protein